MARDLTALELSQAYAAAIDAAEPKHRTLRELTNAELREAYLAAKALQYNASAMRRAAGVFAMERELEAIWAEADRRHIALMRPELD